MKIMFVERIVEYIDPMNVELLSALARRGGHATFLCILQEDDLEQELRRIKPDVVAFSAKTGEHSIYLEAARAVKRFSKSILTVMGGPHCTFFPEIIEEESIDVVGSGECDYAWPLLLDAYQSNRSMDAIPNIFTKGNWFGGFKAMSPDQRRHHLGPRVSDLDGLPFLDRELVYRRTHLRDFPMRSHMTSRGCPFECTYCFEPRFNLLYQGKGKVYQRYSVQRLCEELKEMKERWPTQFIKFYDDMFFVQKTVDPWLEEFAEVYPREVGLPFFCLTRCNVLTEAHVSLLKRAGLHSMTMSIEAGDDYIRDRVIKRHMTRTEILHAFHLCEKYGIVTFANTILGIPVRPEIMKAQGKTAIDYDIESLDLNIESKVVFGEFTTAFPYPGCELADYVTENGWFKKEDFDQLHTSYQSESPFNCFTEKEKLQMNNLSLLGTVCLVLPSLRNVTVNHLINWRLTRLYFLFYYLTKGYLTTFKVYPMNLAFLNVLRNIVRSFRIEAHKHAPGKHIYRKTKIRASTTTPMLGGAPKL